MTVKDNTLSMCCVNHNASDTQALFDDKDCERQHVVVM